MTNSQIDLTGDPTINMAAADQIAIATQHNDGYAASRINATGKMLINGGIPVTGRPDQCGYGFRLTVDRERLQR